MNRQEPSLLFWLEEGEATLSGCGGDSVTLRGTDTAAMITENGPGDCAIRTLPIGHLDGVPKG
jgi:hypothetical protein